ncbi:MAG: zinc ribbon domain-containing protein [Clostridiales bacterium]|nr:zinc ribbon domain-containing protein [Clostridiales bacterium]
MSSSNSFNICPRCGNPNPMSAKYCFKCGGELRLPEEPIVCHHCRTRNTPLANFCRNCGAELKVGYATKICARCGSEVPADQNVCTCGYVFAHTTYTAPIPVRSDGSIDTTGVTATGTPASDGVASDSSLADKKGKKKEKVKKSTIEKAKDGKVYSHKGGRGFALVALILLLVFAYLVMAPFEARPSILSGFDNGITIRHNTSTGDPSPAVAYRPTYGYSMITLLVDAITSGAFGNTIISSGGTVQAIISTLVVIFALAVVVHLIVCLVRIIKPRRSYKPNWLYLALAILTTVVVGLIILFNTVAVGEGFFANVAGIFKLADGWSLGYVLYAIPIYFWFFFLYSLIAKARVLKEETVVPAVGDTTTAA